MRPMFVPVTLLLRPASADLPDGGGATSGGGVSGKPSTQGSASQPGGRAADPVASPSATPKPAAQWEPFDRAKIGAEEPFQVLIAGEERTVVMNGHYQLLDAETRWLVSETPSEMKLPVKAPAAGN